MEADDLRRQTADPLEQAQGEREIADALDAIEAERVFQRALELEAESLEQPHLFSPEQLERIADEINMDVAFVRQAIGEVRLTPHERTWFERRVLPDVIMQVETIEGIPRPDLDALIDDWMTGHEGLIPGANLADGTSWDVDRRLSSRLRASRMAGGNRISRVAGGDVMHRVQSINDDEHVVAMQSDGEGPLLLAKLGLVAAAALIAVGVVTGIDDTPLQFLQGLAAYAVLGAGVATAAVAGARRWAKGIGRALRRSLTGLAGRIGGRRRRRVNDVADLKPVVGELLRGLADRVRAQRAARAPQTARRNPPPPRTPRTPPPPPPRRPPPPRQ